MNTWEYAKYVFNLMRHYIDSGASAYVYWNMILNSKNGESTWGWRQNAMISIEGKNVVYNHEYFVMRHLAEYVAPGAVRIGLEGLFSGLALAFQSEGKTVIAVLNPLPRDYELVLDAGRTYSTVLPADSISTIVLDDAE